MRQGRQAEAADCYGQAIAAAKAAGKEPDARFLYNKGVLSLQLGQEDEAARMLEGAISADPQHVKAMGNLAAVWTSKGRHADAAALLEQALSVLNGGMDEGTSAAAQGKLPADLAVALGNAHVQGASNGVAGTSKDRAVEAYRQALRSHPSHAGAQAQLAALLGQEEL